MAKTKYIMHQCAYCHKQTKMELVGEMQLDGKEGESPKVWYRCTRCKHSALLYKAAITKEKSGNGVIVDRIKFTQYSQEKVFSIGETIYHTDWNDYGKVTAKQKTSNGKSAITVSFEKFGERRLIENFSPAMSNDIVKASESQV